MGLSKLDSHFDVSGKMTSKKVIVWGREDLLVWAVNSLLITQKDWIVTKLSNERGVDGLIQEVEKTHPDTIIVYQSTENIKSDFVTSQLLQAYPGLTVITINPNNNSVEVYEKKQILIEEISDLISVVEGTYEPISKPS